MKLEKPADCSCGCDPRKPETKSPKGNEKPADCSCGCDPRKPGNKSPKGSEKNGEPAKR